MPAEQKETETEANDFKRADELLKEREKLRKDVIKEFLRLHTVYVVEAVAFTHSKDRVERLKELLNKEGFFVRVYRRLI